LRLKEEDNTYLPEVTAEGEEVWEVEKILGKRTAKGQLQYLLCWKGYDESWDTWTPASDFENMDDMVQEYEQGLRLSRTKR